MENTADVCFLWILGFYLGDGSFYIQLAWREATKSITLVPSMTLILKLLPSNNHIMKLMQTTLTNLGVPCRLGYAPSTPPKYDGDHTRPSTVFVKIAGISGLMSIVPLFFANIHFLYWKKDQYNTMLWISRLVSIGGHKTYLGLFSLINFMFKEGQQRHVSFSTWYSRLIEWQAKVNEQSTTGEQHVTHIKDITGLVIGYNTIFPKVFKLSNKKFMISEEINQDEALNAAVMYRNNTITNFLKHNNVWSLNTDK